MWFGQYWYHTNPRELSIGSELIALVMIPQPFPKPCYQQQPSRGRVTGFPNPFLQLERFGYTGFEIKRSPLLGHVGTPIDGVTKALIDGLTITPYSRV